jgi:hypothetical protein
MIMRRQLDFQLTVSLKAFISYFYKEIFNE